MKKTTLMLACALAATGSFALDVTRLVDVTIEASGGETVQYAASELSRLLGRIGVKATVSVAGEAGNTLAIGRTKAVSVKDVRHDGYAIACGKDGVTIAATCGKGVLNGVYQLAEDLGFGFAFPTLMGELVPEKPAELAEGVRTVNPRFAHRGLFDSSDKAIHYDYQAWMEYLAKLRFNSTTDHGAKDADVPAILRRLGFRKEIGGHGMSACLPRDLYKKHPELFRMFQPEDFGGKRMSDSNFCISDPRTQQIVEENFAKKVAQHAADGYYAVHAWADDLPGGGWCMCSRCRSMEGTDQSQLTMNIEARAIRNAGLRLRVPAIAYHDTMFPSETIDPDPLCFLLFAPRERCYAHAIDDPKCARNATYFRALRDWTRRYAKNDDAHTFEYYNDKVLYRGHTPYLPEVIIGDADCYEKHGIETYMSLQIGGPLLAPDWNLLAFARVCWTKGLDRAKLDAELLRGVPAADRAAWTRYLDLRADAYETAFQVCELPYSIYFDYRFMPERAGTFGQKLVSNLETGAKTLAEARKALAAAKLSGQSAYLGDLELKRVAHECTDLEAMTAQQRGLYEIACWRNDGARAHLNAAAGNLRRAITLLRQACNEVRPLALKPGQPDAAGGFGLCYYLMFAKSWSIPEIEKKIAVYSVSTAPVTIPVDFSKELGPVRRLNGMVNTMPMYGARSPRKDLLAATKELEIPCTRFHDASLADPGIELIDISRVFPLFHLDPDDERNYDFAATDELLKRCRATGSEIEYRLGESIEHSPRQFKVHPPKDYAKWAEICVHIIRHYNEGWANGYRWNIRRWSVWEEPDNPPVLFTGDYRKDFLPLYATAAKRIKAAFPNLLVGGPAAGDWRASLVLAEYCAKNGVPLDFLEWDEYERDPDKLLADARAVRARLDELGLKKTENVIAEWHFGPDGWDRFSYPELGQSNQDDLTSVESAAYAAAVLQLFQDGPADQLFYYTGGCGIWGIYDTYRQKRLAWYVFRAFADVARDATRVAAPAKAGEGWYCLASKDKSGKGRIFVSALRATGALKLAVKGGLRPVRVTALDAAHTYVETKGWTWDAEKGELTLARDLEENGVWLVECE